MLEMHRSPAIFRQYIHIGTAVHQEPCYDNMSIASV